MPEISRFFGIIIAMYYNDHRPPHYHATYGEHQALIDVATGLMVAGKLPARAAALVEEWRKRYKPQLERNWALCEARMPLESIRPLE